MSKTYARAFVISSAAAAAIAIPVAVLAAKQTAGGASAPLDDATRAAITRAIDDERAAQRFYEAVIARHGKVRPFTNVLAAEKKHEAELLSVAAAHGMQAPARAAAGTVAVPDTLAASCEAAAAAERENAALLAELGRTATQRNVRATLKRLGTASAKRHLPAFEQCAARAGATSGGSAAVAPSAAAGASAGGAPTCDSCGMGGCGCGAQSPAEKAARAAQAAETGKPAGCGCARARQQRQQQQQQQQQPQQ